MARPLVVLAAPPGWVWWNAAQRLAPFLEEMFAVRVCAGPEEAPPRCDLLFHYSWADVKQYEHVCASRRITHVAGEYPLDRDFLRAAESCHAITVIAERLIGHVDATLPSPRRHGPPIYLCHSGVDMELFPLRPLPQVFTAGWAGRRSGNKGLKIIVEACTLANVPLHVQDARAAPIPFEEMPRFYEGISVYLCASEAEGSPNPVLEALAMGRPVLSTRVGVAPELITPANGALVERVPEAFAQALLSERARARDSAAIRRSVEHRSWAAVAHDEWIPTFQAVLS